jgi:NAD(P)H-flavin reductase
MHTIIGKQNLNATARRLDIKDEVLAAKLRPGHFVTLMLDAASRPVPYHVFEVDLRRKCLSIIFEETDELTRRMGELKINDTVYALNGPYGVAVPLEKKGTIVIVGEELGLVSLLNLARGFKNVGNKVIGIAGFESRKTSLFESQLRLNCNKFYVMHKDGMHERKGDVLGPLKKVLQEEPVVRIFADASADMLMGVRALAAEKGVPVSVNLMAMLQARGDFYPNSSFMVGGRRYFPAAHGIIVDAQGFDVKEMASAADSIREYFSCRKKEAGSLRQRGVLGHLKKLFWA